jgi:uncharacterized membrane protein
MTLLVLEITVPQILSHKPDLVEAELSKRLLDMLLDLWPKIFSYVISFIIWRHGF